MTVPLLALVAAHLFLAAGPVQPAGPPPEALDRYNRTIHAVRLSLDHMRSAPRLDLRELALERRRLHGAAQVVLPDGRSLRTDAPDLAARLRDDRASVSTVSARLDGLDDALHHLVARKADPAGLRDLDDVLRDSRFHPAENPLQQAWSWLLDRLASLLNRLAVAAPSASFASWVFGAVFLALVAGLALLLVRGALARVVVSAETPDPSAEPSTAVAAAGRASGLASAGDYRTALRYLVLQTLLLLQEAGQVELRPGLTNREYLRALQSAARAPRAGSEPLRLLVDEFDRVWYGHLPLDAAGYARCEALAGRAAEAASGRRVA